MIPSYIGQVIAQLSHEFMLIMSSDCYYQFDKSKLGERKLGALPDAMLILHSPRTKTAASIRDCFQCRLIGYSLPYSLSDSPPPSPVISLILYFSLYFTLSGSLSISASLWISICLNRCRRLNSRLLPMPSPYQLFSPSFSLKLSRLPPPPPPLSLWLDFSGWCSFLSFSMVFSLKHIISDVLKKKITVSIFHPLHSMKFLAYWRLLICIWYGKL